MDLQEKLNEVIKKLYTLELALEQSLNDRKDLKKRQKEYQKLIEKAKSLESK